MTPDQLVEQNVIHCVSTLVSEMARGSHLAPTDNPRSQDFAARCQQAMDLYAASPDYEEAAFQHGWIADPNNPLRAVNVADLTGQGMEFDVEINWLQVCEANDIDADDYLREVYECWIVSDWLAEQLINRGEAVDRDFAGLTVWARTTTGQAISLDAVILDIVAMIEADDRAERDEMNRLALQDTL